MRFVVYKHSLILGDNNIVTKQLIALKHDDGTLQFTDFHRYVKSATKIKSISDDGNKRFSYVVKFLNFIYGTVGVNNLDQLTLEMVKEFFMLYGLGKLPEDRKKRKKSTVEKCVNAVLDFLTLYLNERKGKVKLKPKDLYSINTFTNRRGRVIKRKELNFEVFVDGGNTQKSIFRDMPNSAFEMLFAHIAQYHKDLLMVVALGAFVGLRPSEACNVRREDSPLGAGILFHQSDNQVFKIEIDLRKEMPLRSDLKPTGRTMLLTIVTRGKYKELSPSQQTQMIKSLDLTPVEIEKTLELSIRADLRSQQALKTLVENNVEPEQLLTICHRIGNGEAFSKQGESMCLLSALGKLCPYDDRQHCVGCQYELQTKSTLLLLIGEFNRLNKQYSKLTNNLERGKVRAILEKQIKPCLTEMLEALSEQYGEAVLSDYEDIIKELVS